MYKCTQEAVKPEKYKMGQQLKYITFPLARLLLHKDNRITKDEFYIFLMNFVGLLDHLMNIMYRDSTWYRFRIFFWLKACKLPVLCNQGCF